MRRQVTPSWSPAPPSAPGYYWYRSGPGGTPTVVTVDRGFGPPASLPGEWMGPLELPGGEVVVVAPPPSPDDLTAKTHPG